MRKKLLLVLTTLLTASFGMTAYAGSWQSAAEGWWYRNEDGTYPAACWQWIDSNGDGVAECYYFNENGYCLMDAVTPDSCTVDKNGAWIIDGVIQTKAAEPELLSRAQEESGNFAPTEPETAVAEEAGTSFSGISSSPYEGYTILANTNTKKYHVPTCKSVKSMKESNKGYCSDAAYLESMGYDPCKNCH